MFQLSGLLRLASKSLDSVVFGLSLRCGKRPQLLSQCFCSRVLLACHLPYLFVEPIGNNLAIQGVLAAIFK